MFIDIDFRWNSLLLEYNEARVSFSRCAVAQTQNEMSAKMLILMGQYCSMFYSFLAVSDIRVAILYKFH